MNNHLIAALLFLLIGSFGCAKKSLIGDRNYAEELNITSFEFDYLELRNRVKYSSDDMNLNITVNARIKRDSIIWLSVSPGFGFEAARIAATKDSIYILDKLNSDYSVYDYSSLSRQYKVDISYQILQSLFTGNLPYRITQVDQVSKSEGYFRVDQLKPNLKIESKIDAEIMKLTRLLAVDTTGNQVLLDFSDFQLVGEKYFPYRADVQFTNQTNNGATQSKITIDYTKVLVSQEELNFPFDVPQRYR